MEQVWECHILKGFIELKTNLNKFTFRCKCQFSLTIAIESDPESWSEWPSQGNFLSPKILEKGKEKLKIKKAKPDFQNHYILQI